MLSVFRKIRPRITKDGELMKFLRYAFGEILLVVIGILIALQIDNWNEDRKESKVELKILTEISNGLYQDLIDLNSNMYGHQLGLNSCKFWRKAISGNEVPKDSALFHYRYLTRSFLSIQNVSAYESLKSKGLELIKNDSLRIQVIKVYEQDYSILRKLEEEYYELQFQENYFKHINQSIISNFKFNRKGEIGAIMLPLEIPASSKKSLLSILWRIRMDREFVLVEYRKVKTNVTSLVKNIEKELLKF